ncbi:hypothetical protein [Halorientalis salina]|uniref:hypothetical protein n=1 Tax=Halorientalis salina TaxID=2932266 RepID=UPI0010AD0D25|nr:hypothetical protein [Halorientalis salina]
MKATTIPDDDDGQNDGHQDESTFRRIKHLGMLKPQYFGDLIHHEQTSIVIEHGGTELLCIEDPSTMDVRQANMVDTGSGKKATFRCDFAFPHVEPDIDRADDREDTNDDGGEREGDESDDDVTNKHGYETDGKLTFSLGGETDE